MATESFEKMLSCVYESNWYALPVDSQWVLVVILINSQQLYYYHGFGVAVLNLETFTKVSYQFLFFTEWAYRFDLTQMIWVKHGFVYNLLFRF